VDVVGAAYNPELIEAGKRLCGRANFHGSLPRSDLLRLLGRAEVHALVSWTETAGIASIEAAIAGAKLVVGDRGAEIEYFGEDAEYADPADPESIKAAVLRARQRPKRRRGDSLDRRMRALTWRRCAERTLAAYELALC
jgi:glycosyltransferase involved in cell wall biosynthesis